MRKLQIVGLGLSELLALTMAGVAPWITDGFIAWLLYLALALFLAGFTGAGIGIWINRRPND